MNLMGWVRRQYGVPARRGGRVEYTGNRRAGPRLGTITGVCGGHLRIRLDGEKRGRPYHATWELRYLDLAREAAGT